MLDPEHGSNELPTFQSMGTGMVLTPEQRRIVDALCQELAPEQMIWLSGMGSQGAAGRRFVSCAKCLAGGNARGHGAGGFGDRQESACRPAYCPAPRGGGHDRSVA